MLKVNQGNENLNQKIFRPTKLEKINTSDNSQVLDIVWRITTIIHHSWKLQICTANLESNLAIFSEAE